MSGDPMLADVHSTWITKWSFLPFFVRVSSFFVCIRALVLAAVRRLQLFISLLLYFDALMVNNQLQPPTEWKNKMHREQKERIEENE